MPQTTVSEQELTSFFGEVFVTLPLAPTVFYGYTIVLQQVNMPTVQ